VQFEQPSKQGTHVCKEKQSKNVISAVGAGSSPIPKQKFFGQNWLDLGKFG